MDHPLDGFIRIFVDSLRRNYGQKAEKRNSRRIMADLPCFSSIAAAASLRLQVTTRCAKQSGLVSRF
ncbi:hypothetical protein [Bradyrhizobium sp.]|uniref:hypothetical protein n=1 Tax=Bradyrhizobium sp. TaxID=376 RepID=UPI003C634D8E